jgi:methylmalonyl-CoA/ethylmalonyl-CoA epimerase
MPGGPLAHICLLVNDLDTALDDWRRILAVLDPGQLEQPPVVYEDATSGEDTFRWATFVSSTGTEIQLCQPTNDGPMGRALAKRGEGVHHICFTTPDLRGAVARLSESGIELTTERLWQDPAMPWQWWTFVGRSSSHGPLLEIAHPYRAVDGKWEAGEGIVPVEPTEEERAHA